MPLPYEDQIGRKEIYQTVNSSIQQMQNEQVEFKKLHKIIVIVSIFGIFVTYRLFLHHSLHKNCVVDQIHQLTFNINRWICVNAMDPFIGLGQVIMDICVCSSTLYWMLCVKNFRFPAASAFFQYGRSLMLRIITMPYVSYVIWQNPGFPTFSVFYEHTSDYFFSGHTGTLVILYLESRKLNLPIWIKGYLIFSTIYIILMLLIGRVHYTIDVFGGLIYSLYIYDLIDKNLSFFDQLMNCPYRLIDIVKEKVKQKLLKKQDEGTSLYDIQHF